MAARRIENIAGSANSFLDGVDKSDKGSAKVAKAASLAGKNEKLVASVLDAVKTFLDDSDVY